VIEFAVGCTLTAIADTDFIELINGSLISGQLTINAANVAIKGTMGSSVSVSGALTTTQSGTGADGAGLYLNASRAAISGAVTVTMDSGDTTGHGINLQQCSAMTYGGNLSVTNGKDGIFVGQGCSLSDDGTHTLVVDISASNVVGGSAVQGYGGAQVSIGGAITPPGGAKSTGITLDFGSYVQNLSGGAITSNTMGVANTAISATSAINAT